MSDHHRLRTDPGLGEIDHVSHLSDNIGALFNREDYCDITLVVEKTRFPAHKVILAARSEYFRALFFGGMRESQPECEEIEMKDTSAPAFHQLLQYIYTGRMQLSNLKDELLLDVLSLAHQYGFQELETAISNYLQDILNVRNVCLIYDIASIYSLKKLAQTCCEFMDCHASDILQSESFLTLSPSALQEVLSRDSFYAPEVEMFQAVSKWSVTNIKEECDKVMEVVRLPLMNLEDLLNIVRLSNLVSADSILDAIKLKNESRDMDLKYRGFLRLEENIATLRHGAHVIRGEMKAALLDGNNQSYDLDHGFTRHPIDDDQGQGIVVKLAQPSIINTIVLLLWDRDPRSYSYFIEVSMDEKDWVRVVDHSRYLCRSWQYLRFAPTVVKFVRVVGSHNTVNRVFHLVSYECMYSNKSCELLNGIIVPKDNVATVEASACVIEGVSRSRNALINGDTKNYDWDSGYTCHQLGSGAIVVQLAQPYVIGSMRLLLWDCDGRSYSYYVEVSTDQQNWQTVADKTTEACRSWQVIVFEKRPVTFVKIVGTHNTANEVFHCVHFECPADPMAIADQTFCPASKPVTSTASTSVTVSIEPRTTVSAAPGSFCQQPCSVAMARVNPMPNNSLEIGGLGMHNGVHARFSNTVTRSPSTNRTSILQANPEDVPGIPGIHHDLAQLEDSLSAVGAVGGLDHGNPAVMEPLDRDSSQGMKIIWIDRGDGLGMENEEVTATSQEDRFPQGISDENEVNEPTSPRSNQQRQNRDSGSDSDSGSSKTGYDKNGNKPSGPF